MNSLNNKLDDLLLRGQREVADTDLFAPVPPKEDCPVCFLPLPVRDNDVFYMCCCGKHVCGGCIYSSGVNGLKVQCVFCREPFVSDHSPEHCERLERRMEKQDPLAFMYRALQYEKGEGDLNKAI